MKIVKRPHGHYAGEKFYFTSIRLPLKVAQGVEAHAIKSGASVTDAMNQIMEGFLKTSPAPRVKLRKTLKASKHAREVVKVKVKARTAKKAKVAAKVAKVKAKSGVKPGGKKKAAPVLATAQVPKPERRKADKRVRKVKAAVEKAAEALDAAKEHLAEKAETPTPNGATSEHHEVAQA